MPRRGTGEFPFDARFYCPGHGDRQKILSLGVTLRSGVGLTESFGLAELRRDGFESVFLSVGVSKLGRPEAEEPLLRAAAMPARASA